MIKPGTRGFVEGAACRVERGGQYAIVVRVLQDFVDEDNNYFVPGEMARVVAEDFTPAKHDIPGEEDAATS